MDDMQTQMNQILGNPEMMQKIMAMAQSMNAAPAPEQEQAPPAAPFPEIDLATFQRLSGIAGQANIDGNQRSLLKALTPYLSRDRIGKLERAMRAARLANLASGFLSRTGGSFLNGR